MNFQPKFDSNALRVEPVDSPSTVPAASAEPARAEPEPPKRDEKQANGLILRLSFVGFITALASRVTDPIIPPIAHDIQVDPNSVALLTTAFALPFALAQPFLGPIGDMVGKVRVMIACLAVTIAAMLICGLATNFSTIFIARIIAGAAAGGIFPVGMAVIGDLVPIGGRQVAIGRWLAAVITGNLLGSSLSGVIADLAGWRGVFFTITALGLVALVVAVITLRHAARAKKIGFSLRGFSAGYGAVFSNPLAKVCFSAVFAEGLVIFGLFPFVALLLLRAGEPRSSVAGAVIAGFSVGGVTYALLVKWLIARWRPDQLMIAGGVLAAVALLIVSVTPAWPFQILAFTLLGMGFYTMHACIQVQATELSTTARGAALSMHSFFFFVGQAAGPVIYSAGFLRIGTVATLIIAAVFGLLIGVITPRFLWKRDAGV